MDTKFDLSNRLYYLLLAGIVGVLVYAGVNIGFWLTDDSEAKQFTVSGEGKIYVKPDIAIAVFGVKTEGKKSDEVAKLNSEKMNAIIKAVKEEGVPEKDIQTSMYNLSPKYNYTEDRGSFLDGYALSQQITVKIRNFEKITVILEKATRSGANEIGSLQITVDDPEFFKAEARKKAIAAAKKKAQDMAKESGIKLGKITEVSESYSNYQPYPMAYKAEDGFGRGGATSSAPQIEAGEKEIIANVSLTYKIR